MVAKLLVTFNAGKTKGCDLVSNIVFLELYSFSID